MNNVKPTFVARNLNSLNSPPTFDALKFIKEYLAQSPTNRIRPNSLLYNLAIDQYNKTLKITLTRPEIPSWFCGKINAETGELFGATDSDRRVAVGVTGATISTVPPPTTAIRGKYLEDVCLNQGTAGTIQYARCRNQVSDANQITQRDLSGINWSASLMQAESEADAVVAQQTGSGGSGTGRGSEPSTNPLLLTGVLKIISTTALSSGSLTYNATFTGTESGAARTFTFNVGDAIGIQDYLAYNPQVTLDTNGFTIS